MTDQPQTQQVARACELRNRDYGAFFRRWAVSRAKDANTVGILATRGIVGIGIELSVLAAVGGGAECEDGRF